MKSNNSTFFTLTSLFKHIIILVVALIFGAQSFAQLGFCDGNSGAPIFSENFGSGTTTGPPLAIGTTTYAFANEAPNDGFYTVSSTTNWYGWHNTPDHTPNDTNGKCLVVNADFDAGEFFRTTISGLCENTSYEFSAWLINLLPGNNPFCDNGGIPINVKFEIWDASDSNLLASGDTGAIQGTNNPVWENYGLVFQTLPGQGEVVLKMINNAPGGCGNDLAIDDIVFKSCGDFVVIEDENFENDIIECEGQVVESQVFTAVPDFSVFDSHAYQWQKSVNNGPWEDIPGANEESYVTPIISEPSAFRVKFAQDELNLSNSYCNSISEVFSVSFTPVPQAPESGGDVSFCGDDFEAISVTVPDQVLVNWYDAANGGELLLENSESYIPDTEGFYYAEAVSEIGGCVSQFRTEIQVTLLQAPVVEDEIQWFCEGEETTLYANVINTTYLWNTGETISQITVNTPGVYTVLVTKGNGCSKLKTIELIQIDAPIIESVSVDGNDLTVIMGNEGDFEYALNGVDFQQSQLFTNVGGGLYNIIVREINGCGFSTIEYLHFVVPKFFTPNGDGYNDTFDLAGIENYRNYQVQIFDRYGRLIVSSTKGPFSWNGKFNGLALPTNDYWYSIIIDEQSYFGHFSLKR